MDLGFYGASIIRVDCNMISWLLPFVAFFAPLSTNAKGKKDATQ